MTTTYGPYTPIRQAGNLWFVSGQVGIDPETKTASPDITEQTRQVLTNMQRVLETENLTLNDVVKTTIFVTNIEDFAAVNEVYEAFFDTPRPARSTVQVADLPHLAGDVPLTVEIEAVACKESAQ